jgi:hypothetical protein
VLDIEASGTRISLKSQPLILPSHHKVGLDLHLAAQELTPEAASDVL